MGFIESDDVSRLVCSPHSGEALPAGEFNLVLLESIECCGSWLRRLLASE